MLPLRARLEQLLKALAEDSALRRRLVTVVTAIVLAIVVMANGGLSINIQIGRRAADTRANAGRSNPRDSGRGGVVARDESAGASDAALTPSGVLGAAGGTGGTARRGGAAGTASSGGAGVARATPANCQGAKPTDSDQGVSKDTIKVGVEEVDLAALSQLGFGLNTGNVTYSKIENAWTKEVNDHGGVACRKVALVHEITQLDVDAQTATCKKLTEDDKVFAVLSTGGLVAGAQCISKDHKTPLLANLGAPEVWDREGAPYEWDVLMTQERILRNHARWLVDTHQVVPGNPNSPGVTKVGVVYADENYSGPSVESALIDEFKKWNVTPLRVTKLSADFEQAAAQMAQVVLDYQMANISLVTMPTNLIYKTQFMQQAEKQRYFPTYTDSDVTVGCIDFVTGTYPPSEWDKTKCLTEFLVNGMSTAQLDKYFSTNPYAQYADRVYKATNPEGYDNNGQSNDTDRLAQRNLHYLVGTLLLMMKQAADRVGVNLTRPAWGAEMGRTGTFTDVAGPHPLSFGPTKWSGPDHLAVVQWHAEASDDHAAATYHQLAPPFKSSY